MQMLAHQLAAVACGWPGLWVDGRDGVMAHCCLTLITLLNCRAKTPNASVKTPVPYTVPRRSPRVAVRTDGGATPAVTSDTRASASANES